MSSHLDMPLDDIINLSRQGRGGATLRGRRGRGGGRRGASFGSRGGKTMNFLGARRPTAFQLTKSYLRRRPDSGWRRGLFEDAVGSALGIETGAKLYISNLDYGVSNEDIQELFSEVGPLKHCGIHYDRSGRSNGTANVVFLRRQDAIDAMKRYNAVMLDGKPMKIELIGVNPPPAAAVPRVIGGRGITTALIRGRGARGRIGFRSFRGRGRGRGRRPLGGDRKLLSADELDADLDKYHKDAMET